MQKIALVSRSFWPGAAVVAFQRLLPSSGVVMARGSLLGLLALLSGSCGDLPTTTGSLPIPSGLGLETESLPAPPPTATPLTLTPSLLSDWNLAPHELVLLVQRRRRDLVAQLPVEAVARWYSPDPDWPGIEGIDLTLTIGSYRETATAQLRLGQAAIFTFADPPTGTAELTALAFSGPTTVARGEMTLTLQPPRTETDPQETTEISPLRLIPEDLPFLQQVRGKDGNQPATDLGGAVLEPLTVNQTLTLLGSNLEQVSEVLFATNFPASVVAGVPPRTGEILEQSPTRLTVKPPPDLALSTTAVTVQNINGAGLGRLDITWKPATRSSPSPPSSPPPNFWRVQAVTIDSSAAVSPGLPESPRAVVADPEGGFYIADQARHQILYLSPEGKLKIWAGTGQPGSKDGPAAEAQFQRPAGLAFDQDGSLLVVDQGNHQIRRINRSGQVSTVAGAPSPGFVDGGRFRARFRDPSDLVVTSDGGMLVADSGNHRIRYIQPTGDVVTLAGSGQKGFKDGAALEASFDTPTGLALAPDTSLWIADQGNHRIRRLTLTEEVETVAGGEAGFADGIGEKARFQLPTELEMDDKGILYIADQGNHRIRRLGPEKTVTTLAGTGESGTQDGSSAQAQFQEPVGLWLHNDGSLIVADQESAQLRQIAPVPTQIGDLPVTR